MFFVLVFLWFVTSSLPDRPAIELHNDYICAIPFESGSLASMLLRNHRFPNESGQ